MTTVKEFEEQKQEIAIKLNDALDAMLELKPNLASNIVADQIKAIHKLQPPRPTCATCKYFNTSKPVSICENDNVQFDLLQKKIVGLSCDFGCVHHSEYKEVKNA